MSTVAQTNLNKTLPMLEKLNQCSKFRAEVNKNSTKSGTHQRHVCLQTSSFPKWIKPHMALEVQHEFSEKKQSSELLRTKKVERRLPEQRRILFIEESLNSSKCSSQDQKANGSSLSIIENEIDSRFEFPLDWEKVLLSGEEEKGFERKITFDLFFQDDGNGEVDEYNGNFISALSSNSGEIRLLDESFGDFSFDADEEDNISEVLVVPSQINPSTQKGE